jgi:hypothetical protein
MALDERARHELFLRLEQVLGPESAETLMEMMPPVGWADVATKRDLDTLEERMGLRFDLIDQRFEASEHKLLAAFRGELLAQSNVITAQTRTLLIANVGTVLSLAALAFGVAKLT